MAPVPEHHTMVNIEPAGLSIWTYLNPLTTLRSLLVHRHLIFQFARRDVVQRYKGSVLGLVWSIVTPLITLAVYTFVFSVIFQAKWGQSVSDSRAEFPLTLFCGLIMYALFTDCVGRASGLIVGHANYVKKVVFPLEILPIVSLASALFFAAIGFTILLVGIAVFLKTFSVTLLCFPLVLVTLLLLTAGLSWFLASLGVYLRDVGHLVQVLLQLLFFLSPIFYPMEAVPAKLQVVLKLNPLAAIIRGSRQTLMWGTWPDWGWLLAVFLVSAVVAQLGYAWFMVTKRGFADVI